MDVLIERVNCKLSFSIFRKSTFSGLGTSFFSFCNFQFKINAVKTLLHRAFSLSSSYELFHKEVKFLKQFFTNNGYPESLFHRLVKGFLNNKYQPRLPIPTVNKDVMYVTIPYLGQASVKMVKRLNNDLSKFYPQINFRFIPVNPFKIGSYFNVKDRLPSELRSSIVYQFICPSCQAGYVGSTMRAFKTRVDEHTGHSSRTGQRLHSPPHSAVRDHTETCGVVLKFDHFKIIDSVQSNLRVLESMYIKKLSPELNNTVSAAPLNIL